MQETERRKVAVLGLGLRSGELGLGSKAGDGTGHQMNAGVGTGGVRPFWLSLLLFIARPKNTQVKHLGVLGYG